MLYGRDGTSKGELLIDIKLCNMVKEFTPDMANSMQKIVRKCFPRTLQIVNKIHVFTLVTKRCETYAWPTDGK
ncbi:hypothetical protein E7X19_14975 [Bacteroides fragilis]|nr:hypothetical protein E7X03_12100 [Bacteroides fragilis]THC72038.1 hypothetical protein E7X19_14975 [Bacteroides fragilis]THC84528.1 hypothetical protein E7X23_14730 [Bacteroides fragilis]